MPRRVTDLRAWQAERTGRRARKLREPLAPDGATHSEQRVYHSGKWQRKSRAVRAVHPWCEHCGHERDEGARLSVHHDPPLRVILERGLDPYAQAWLTVLCHHCHRRADETRRVAETPAGVEGENR